MQNGRKSFEQAFNDMEASAASTLKSVKALEKLTKALQKAAQDGNINAIKKAHSELGLAMSSLRQEVANAVNTWSWTDEAEEEYLKEGYADELCHTAREKGLRIYEKDDRLISSPFIVRILPRDRAVKIGRKKVSTLRPSRLVELLSKSQKIKPRVKPNVFLEELYEAYSFITTNKYAPIEQSSTNLINPKPAPPTVLLVDVHKVLTILHGSSRDYNIIDFARDIYALDASGLSYTKKGFHVSFHASTGTRSARNTVQFFDPNGKMIKYYGIQFSGGK